ncbi:DUF3955 domain-containing protein [Pelagibius sp. Alg239-R121]|uniref:DUF3955 domain-containing protein n=1 Tax=Pelagibius sp. Alg239-R121 TaxID=2993448 RepID=UPI0024A71779|nr:DUF3955 domain-containing protein [Pelagibius sp. Alg239-R121]
MAFKIQITGIAALVASAISLLLENIFYGYVGAEGVLQESLFLPIGFLLLALGAALVAVGLAVRLFRPA